MIIKHYPDHSIHTNDEFYFLRAQDVNAEHAMAPMLGSVGHCSVRERRNSSDTVIHSNRYYD